MIERDPRYQLALRDKEIRQLRLKEAWTLQKIGDLFGISRERVRQICNDIPAIGRLRSGIDRRINASIDEERRAYRNVEAFHDNYIKREINKCWNWTGARNPVTGYGIHTKGERTTFAGVGRLAHRIAWYLAHGIIPPRGKGNHIMHACDNPICVNPTHLVLGTAKMNHDDAVAKGRKVLLRRSMRSLTDDQARDVRQMYATGEWSLRGLSSKFGISRHSITLIVRGITYKDV